MRTSNKNGIVLSILCWLFCSSSFNAALSVPYGKEMTEFVVGLCKESLFQGSNNKDALCRCYKHVLEVKFPNPYALFPKSGPISNRFYDVIPEIVAACNENPYSEMWWLVLGGKCEMHVDNNDSYLTPNYLTTGENSDCWLEANDISRKYGSTLVICPKKNGSKQQKKVLHVFFKDKNLCKKYLQTSPGIIEEWRRAEGDEKQKE